MITFIKKLLVPFTNETKWVDAVQMWEVRWLSRDGRWHTDLTPELECFSNEKEAQEFAQSLKNAFALLKHTGEGTSVSMSKAK